MKIDIEKLNRKMPYPEPSDDFFKTLQDNVILKTIGEQQVVVKKEAKIFSPNFKWMAAAAVVLIAGITAFFGLNDNLEMQMAQQKPIIDSVYEIHSTEQKPANTMADNHSASNQTPSVGRKVEHLKSHPSINNLNLAKSENHRSNSFDNTDRQSYAVETKRRSESEVEKVLVAFTPDQIKDIDRNSEQDVYLDLYN
ncbi:hypothetical protein [Epilithonimonas sp.]|uniref:hypothetical protein n=1 Tax=Epilithonimonas sp. TaxID=2894511 RepID=UPI0028A0465A|nr:hypothetical protein [Epilithonimonas sp.]